jgi:hypothetical protein
LNNGGTFSENFIQKLEEEKSPKYLSSKSNPFHEIIEGDETPIE